MKILSVNEGLRLGPLFSVIYPTQCSPLLVEAGTQQMQWDEEKNNSNEIFEHPTVDLELLFNALRRYGQLPSPVETQAIQGFVKECQDDVDILRSKISDSISTISRLSRELSETSCLFSRRLAQVKLGEYLLPSPGSSPNLLPQDVLEQIFLACLPDRELDTISSPNHPPLQLASVCHRWRIIALSLPKLWSHVFVDSSIPSSCNLAKAWIQRSTFNHLTIKLRSNGQNVQDFLAFLQSSGAKLRSLDVTFRVEDEAQDIWSQITQIDCTELSELVCKYKHPRIELPSSPQLKYLYLYRVPTSWEGTTPPSQLTVLSATWPVHWSMLEHILSCCPALQCVLLSIAEFGPHYSGHSNLENDGVTSPPVSTLYHLKTFCLKNECKNDYVPTNLLHTFTFPALDTFEYYVKHPSRATIPWLTSLEFIQQIRRLSLHISEVRPTMLSPVLNAAASVEDLSITCRASHTLPPILELLSTVSQSLTVAPRLERLQFTFGVPFSDLEEHSPRFVELIKSMSTPVSGRPIPLRRLRIASWKGLEGSAVQFRSMLGDCDAIDLEIYGLGSVMFKYPFGFAMYVPPSNHVQELSVLQPDGSWKKHFGHLDIV
ncbi:hypothetical protein BDN72DRAFT_964837 [Pluteus cervinus]|uniref:Uncharacterized protein n=1 Tax=Pluteus cervinus TaxID=181527 RepID=A0ACD3A998_9AGAR|nr:hypothetical protein BDN72DRAFT_964837 [Pluteus cervinus]